MKVVLTSRWLSMLMFPPYAFPSCLMTTNLNPLLDWGTHPPGIRGLRYSTAVTNGPLILGSLQAVRGGDPMVLLVHQLQRITITLDHDFGKNTRIEISNPATASRTNAQPRTANPAWLSVWARETVPGTMLAGRIHHAQPCSEGGICNCQ